MCLVFTSCGCTPDGVSVPCIWWSLCTLYLHSLNVHPVEFMYLVFGGMYVLCIYIFWIEDDRVYVPCICGIYMLCIYILWMYL